VPNYLKSFTQICYPDSCYACAEPLAVNEEIICVKCQLDLPLTHFNLRLNNPVLGAFAGRVPLLRAAAYLHFQQGGIVQRLLHLLKYSNKPEVGHFLGGYAAEDWRKGVFLRSVDFLVPVPLHPDKEKKRGYNQALKIAEGMGQVSEIPIADALTRIEASSSQTRKGRYDRYLNVGSIFELQPAWQKHLEGKHLLVIDDVLTTGSTVEGCLIALQAISGVKLSVFTVAYAQ
jgi:ComF family protein